MYIYIYTHTHNFFLNFFKEMFKIMFYILFFKMKTSEQHTAKNLVNLVYYPIGFV